MTVAAMRRKLCDYLEIADEKKVKAIYALVEENIENRETEKLYNHWEDESFVAEMERRYEEVESGKVKLVSLDDVEKKARAVAAKLKGKK